MAAYYNEIDPFAAAWLRELIKAGLIADGEVDERSIADVSADDVRGFTQCHFFAGIGGWSYALRLAGWPDDREVWTGSCPCQPFSAAGKALSADDPRHLWPTWFQLIAELRPGVVFGEQVDSADGLAWLDVVSHDVEASGYAVGAIGLPACSVGAFHRRQRLWFVADASGERRQQDARSTSRDEDSDGRQSHGDHVVASHGENGRMDDTEGGRREDGHSLFREHDREVVADGRGVGFVGDTERERCESGHTDRTRADQSRSARGLDGPWNHVTFIACGDGKMRPIKPGLEPLVDGVPEYVAMLRGYGNAIVPQVAAAFIEAYCDARGL